MFHGDKLINIKITDNAKGITNIIRTQYNHIWSKEALLERMFIDIKPYDYWKMYFCTIE